MQSWRVHTPEGLVLRQDLAGAGSRMLAGLVDFALQALILLLGLFGLYLLGDVLPSELQSISNFALGLALGSMLLGPVLYGFLFELLQDGQTPGKRLLGLRVRDLDAAAAHPGKLLIRALFRPLDVLLLVPLPIGLILIAALPLGQRLGDLAAGTIVVRESRARAARRAGTKPRWSQLPEKLLKLEPALASRFSARDAAFLRALLERGDEPGRRELSDEARRRLYVETAREFAGRIGVHEFADARRVLEELALFLEEYGPAAR
jgi:uncharacterized RDD family membrane protein YckC